MVGGPPLVITFETKTLRAAITEFQKINKSKIDPFMLNKLAIMKRKFQFIGYNLVLTLHVLLF